MGILIRAFLIIVIVGVGLFLVIPNSTDPYQSSNDASAINSIRQIVTSQITYSDTTGRYAPDLAVLLAEGLIDSALGSGTKDGYTLSTHTDGEDNTFRVNATPLSQAKKNHLRSFYADETGVIRYTEEDRPAWFKDPPLGQ